MGRGVLVRGLSRAGICAARAVVCAAVPDVVKVAALVNIAGAAASLARSVAKLRRIDPAMVDQYVTDRADARAVLGRGRWLPTMVRAVPVPADIYTEPVPAPGRVGSAAAASTGRGSRRGGGADHPVLFTWPTGGGGR
jgi:hypothetical protein